MEYIGLYGDLANWTFYGLGTLNRILEIQLGKDYNDER
jgi:hypothetical protein